MIEVAEANEGTDVSEFLWCRPFIDPFEFCRVHSYYSVFDYHSEEVNFFFVEGAFGRFKE